MLIGIVLIAYLVLLMRSLGQVGKRTQAEPRQDIKKPVLTYAICSPIIYFCSYFISQSETDTELFFVLNSCMLLAFWAFAFSVIFFKFFFDGDNKLFIRDFLIASLALLAFAPVYLWVKNMVPG